MTKCKGKPAPHHPNTTSKPAIPTLSTLRQDAALWFRIHVLLYDLTNVISDSLSQERLEETAHPLYISGPYFTESEASIILTTLVDAPAEAAAMEAPCPDSLEDKPSLSNAITVEELIQSKLANFLTKRKASGDARPCGPHDMYPVYASVFGIQQGEIKDERFLSRVRRSGVGTATKAKVDTSSKAKRGGGRRI